MDRLIDSPRYPPLDFQATPRVSSGHEGTISRGSSDTPDMAISFECSCGKQFTVKEEFAGKRTKCPACGAALTVPASSSSAEDEAFRLLQASDESDVSDEPSRPSRPDRGGEVQPGRPEPPPSSPTPLTPPRSAPKPPPVKRGPSYQPREEADPGGFRISLSPAVAGGLASMAIAAMWFGLGLTADRIYIYPPILFVLGLVAVVKGVLGHPEE
jgi:hypothetical protein